MPGAVVPGRLLPHPHRPAPLPGGIGVNAVRWLRLVAAVAIGAAVGGLWTGSDTVFGLSLAVAMVAVIAADVIRTCTTNHEENHECPTSTDANALGPAERAKVS